MIKAPSVSQKTYFVVINDEYYRFSQAVPIRKKSEVSEVVLNFERWFERQSGNTVRGLHTDGGKYYNVAKRVLKERGVYVSKTTGYNPS